MDAAGAASSASDDSGHTPLHADSLPLIDLRLLTQSELYSLSLSTSSSASSAHDDGVLIPKIDRSVFNESAGSRKQTFSRLRLAPRGTAAASSSSSSSSALSRQKPPPPPHEPLDEDNSRIISLLQRLFAKDAPSTDPAAQADPPIVAAGRDDDADLIQVRIDYDECLTDCSTTAVQSVPIEVVDLGPMKRKRGRPRKFKNAAILGEADDAAGLFENDGEGTATETKSNEDSVRLEDSMKVI
ncbi:methyl-CpG-binding domain-containing protein 8-like [Rhodamnia argentea]|uniref:Methyl-CpG-binding domain-containing protein 8-like n=1 Tax=Rhodamnia argentea TaxID=178133 RepID=A0A8B8P182_9MYRT|nr:methyl-CpG-binding domain-containing protein 8-like [Rhodamnia argentea]